jgi:protein-tyrosine phosphatase
MTPHRKTAAAKRPTRTKGPSEIAPGVFVGGWKDAVQFEGARFCVLDEAPEDMPPATHVRIYDEAKGGADRRSLDRLVRGMQAARAKGESVLVFCGHGIRRSPLGGAWYLRNEEGLTLDGAYVRIQAVRPQVERPRDWLENADELERP